MNTRPLTLGDVPLVIESGPFAIIAHEGKVRVAAITSNPIYRDGRRQAYQCAFQDLLEKAIRNDPGAICDECRAGAQR